jgi:hypothetical protein
MRLGASMVETTDIGQPGGQQFDVQKAIRTFLKPRKEHGASVASMVMREFLQNADGAGANSVAVILDERPAPRTHDGNQGWQPSRNSSPQQPSQPPSQGRDTGSNPVGATTVTVPGECWRRPI